MFVAVKARECFEVVWRGMACLACIPFIPVCPGINWEIQTVMIERSAVPSFGRVALQTSGGETGPGVFAIEVRLMTGNAIVLIGGVKDEIESWKDVTTLARQRSMGPDERVPVGRCSMIERSAVPRLGRVALQTSGGETGPGVFAIEVRLMTGNAIVLIGGVKAKRKSG